MRASRFYLPTLREAPAEAELISHRLLLRGGFIRKLSAGVYSYLPLGLRVLNKVAGIVREEANRIGAVELLMPALVPFDLLRETGRDAVEVLYRTTDRTNRHFALGFTHEEVITDIVRSSVQSYRDLPLCLYQIQTKFRDEPRPRAGLIRAKEFEMFDAYSFDADDEAVDRIYKAMWQAYERMFQRVGLTTLVCEAEAGDIGGSDNHEFMVVTPGGEDRVLLDEKSGVAANAERCDIGGVYEAAVCDGVPPAERVETPGKRTVEEVTEFLNVSADRLVKTLLVRAGGEPVAALVRGDRELNPYKLARRLGVSKVEMLGAAEVQDITGADVGFAGPVGLDGVRIVADQEIRSMAGFVVGANQDDTHLVNVCHGRDFEVAEFMDIRVAQDGDPSPGGGVFREVRGIEVGHIFKLGTRYSEPMGAVFTDESGDEKPILMGCYGLGIGRTMQAVAEVSHDEAGIIWPISIAPFEVVVIVVNPEEDAQCETAEQVYQGLLSEGIEALLDDRDERAGVKFKDADLIGYPLRVVCGRTVAEGSVEAKWRRDAEAVAIPIDAAVAMIAKQVRDERARYA
jgi:prolyl-tRNA synthetase